MVIPPLVAGGKQGGDIISPWSEGGGEVMVRNERLDRTEAE